MTNKPELTTYMVESILSHDQTPIFCEEIEQHFSSIKINSYRALNNLEVNKISRVNLFTGKNNGGKTSLLEAIYLLCKQNDFNGLLEMLRGRGKMPQDKVSTVWFTEHLPDDISITGIFDNKEASINIRSLLEENEDIERTFYIKTIEILSTYANHQQRSMTRIFNERDRQTRAKTIKVLTRVILSSPFYLKEPKHYMPSYRNAVRVKLLQKIIQFIQENIVASIKDIRLVDEQRFLVEDDNFSKAVDLTSYGEGLQRIFFISLLFASVENGVLLIDEFENAIHVDLLNKFTPFMYSLAKEFNVQVFLTTHSKECVDSFVKNIPKTDMNDFAFHSIVKDNDKIILREFSGKDFAKLIDAMNVDLRRAK